LGVSGKPEPEKALYWIKRAEEFEQKNVECEPACLAHS